MPEDALSNALILAAIERTERHMPRKERGALYGMVVDHLGLPRHSGTGRRFRPRLKELEAAGIVESFRRNSCVVWTLTPKGQKQLKNAGPVTLPESPQHRRWRESRSKAIERMAGFRGELRDALKDARALLGNREAPSEAWFELGERLQRACSLIGSATHCSREWPEPSDDEPDVDRGPWLGRRSMLRDET
jgi:hypothetical protein